MTTSTPGDGKWPDELNYFCNKHLSKIAVFALQTAAEMLKCRGYVYCSPLSNGIVSLLNADIESLTTIPGQAPAEMKAPEWLGEYEPASFVARAA